MLETIERMARVATVRLSAQPNAGRPREIEGRNIYLCSPEYMASYARRFINAGVRLVGGCCGTTPDHIRHIKLAVRALDAGRRRPRARAPAGGRRRPRPAAAVAAGRAAGEVADGATRSRAAAFVVIVELVPPRGYRADALVEQARQLRIHGVDLVNIPDGPRAGARMSALAAAMPDPAAGRVSRPILHYACRDRNLLGMQSDLLGAHSMGVRNLLIVTGDPPQVGDYPDATAVFDVDSIGLTNVVATAEPRPRHRRAADRPADGVPHRRGGEPRARSNLDEEIRRFEYKVEAGAEFAITQPVFDARGARSVPRADRGVPDPDHRGRDAAREPPARRVHGQRGARRARAGRDARADAPRRDAAGRAAAEGAGDRARDRRGDPSAGAGDSDLDAPTGTRPGGVRRSWSLSGAVEA